MALYDRFFFNGLTRKYIAAFGAMFNNIQVVRYDNNGNENCRERVPLTFAPKEKYVYKLKRDLDLSKRGPAIKLPRMSFDMTSFQYDSARRAMAKRKLCVATDERGRQFTYAPVPYRLNFDLNIYTKSLDEMHQVVEQIIPFFGPDYSVRIKPFKNSETVKMVLPFALTGISPSDSYEGSFDDRRMIIWTLSFTVPVEYFGPLRGGKYNPDNPSNWMSGNGAPNMDSLFYIDRLTGYIWVKVNTEWVLIPYITGTGIPPSDIADGMIYYFDTVGQVLYKKELGIWYPQPITISEDIPVNEEYIAPEPVPPVDEDPAPSTPPEDNPYSGPIEEDEQIVEEQIANPIYYLYTPTNTLYVKIEGMWEEIPFIYGNANADTGTDLNNIYYYHIPAQKYFKYADLKWEEQPKFNAFTRLEENAVYRVEWLPELPEFPPDTEAGDDPLPFLDGALFLVNNENESNTFYRFNEAEWRFDQQILTNGPWSPQDTFFPLPLAYKDTAANTVWYLETGADWVQVQFIQGNGVPQDVVGSEVIYKDLTTGTVYIWNGSGWEEINVIQASGVPDNTLGQNGDYYLDTATGYIYIKIDGVWVLTSLRGQTTEPSADAPDYGVIYSVKATMREDDGRILSTQVGKPTQEDAETPQDIDVDAPWTFEIVYYGTNDEVPPYP